MRISLILAFAGALMSFAWSEVTKYVYQGDGLYVEYSKEHGMLTNRYVSYWPNGRKKAEGEMRGNMRFGQWALFDSTGKLVMARNYETGYAWTQSFPIAFDLVTSKTWFPKTYSLFTEIKPDSVTRSARLWRFVPYQERNAIFANNALIDTLIAMRKRGAVQCGEDDEMMMLSSYSEFAERLEKCNPQRHVIGYRIKEDWFYDAKKLSGYYAIVNICPVLYAKNERDSIDLGWFLYDATLRNKMGTMFYAPPSLSPYPVGVEQTFFLRCFTGDVYKYTNVKGQTIAQLFPDKEARAKEVQRMDVQPLEWEHEEWLKTFK
jgi:hypothetical protein